MKTQLLLALLLCVVAHTALTTAGLAEPSASTTVDSQSLDHARTWRTWMENPGAHALTIPEPRYPEVYEHLLWFINKTKKSDITFIDVGCAVGDYLKVVERFSKKPVHSIGIDPIDWPGRVPYTTFRQVGIAKEAKDNVTFNLYGGQDLATSSLKRLKKENVTHDPQEQDKKFYHPVAIEGEHGTSTIRTIPLSQVIQEAKQSDYIDIVKVDTQGTDLEVILSAGDALQRVLFVQLESIVSENPSQRLYEDQTTFTHDRATLEARGFKVFNVAAFPAGPEADVVFVNTKLFSRIAEQEGIVRP